MATALVLVSTQPCSNAYQVKSPLVWALSSNRQFAVLLDMDAQGQDLFRYSVHSTSGRTDASTIAQNPILWTIGGGWTNRVVAPAISDDGRIAAVVVPDVSSQKTHRLELWCSTGIRAATSMDMHDRKAIRPSETEWYDLSISGSTVAVTYAFYSCTSRSILDANSRVETRRDMRRVSFSVADCSFIRSATLPDSREHTIAIWNRYRMAFRDFVFVSIGGILCVLVLVFILRKRSNRGPDSASVRL